MIFYQYTNRYELNDAKNSATSEHVLEVWCYEAYRLFRDRLVGSDARNRFDNIMATVVRSEWSANVFDNLTCKCEGHVQFKGCIFICNVTDMCQR